MGRVGLADEQPCQWPDNWLYLARSFRLADVSPYKDASVWRLYVTYKLPDTEPRTDGLAVGIDRPTAHGAGAQLSALNSAHEGLGGVIMA